jgi:serine/threonine protein kinase
MKLADFGFAVKADGDNVDAQLGTPGYIAPEILENKKYGAWPYSLLL